MALGQALPTRFDYTIAGALLLSLTLVSDIFSRQIAITLTYCAFAVDLVRNRPDYPAPLMWAFATITTAGIAVYLARGPRVRAMFLLLTFSAVAISLMKALLPPAGRAEAIGTQAAFLGLALVIAVLLRRPRPLSYP
jgi:hypothetical protein